MYRIRHTQAEDVEAIISLCKAVYPHTPPYREPQLASQLMRFPEGHFVVATYSGEIVGMTSSLLLKATALPALATWDAATDRGFATNHDSRGDVLYAIELMVDPKHRRKGIAKLMHHERAALAATLGVGAVRAGVRLSCFGVMPPTMTAEEYYRAVVRKDIGDASLQFHFALGYQTIGIVENYLRNDPDCRNTAAVMDLPVLHPYEA